MNLRPASPIPTHMRAIEMAQPGGPEVLQICQRQVPVPAQKEVLIRISAAGVNRPDLLQREGLYPPPPGASDLLGLEVAGEIVAVGEGVTEQKLGGMVCALLNGGGYAEYAAIDQSLCLPVPQGFSLVEAAALPETFFTVWHNLFQRAQLQAGETCLIHGGSSGIGTTAIQMATAMGARVFVTAGSDEKCAQCVELGAEQAVNYRTGDFVSLLKEKTQGRGVDVILDMVGGDYLQRNMRLAARDGRLLSIAFLQGAKVEVDFTPLLIKRLKLMGSTLRAQSIQSKIGIAKELKEHIWPLLDQGRIKPVIDSTYPLAEACRAHRRMAGSQHIGKIVLQL